MQLRCITETDEDEGDMIPPHKNAQSDDSGSKFEKSNC